jgi:hypothetical protein
MHPPTLKKTRGKKVKKPPVHLALAALALSLIAAGCGGDSEAATPSKAQFAKQADAICAKTTKRIEAEVQSYIQGPKAKEIEEEVQASELTSNEAAARVTEEILIPAKENQLEELEAIGIPSEGEAEAKALVASYAEGIEKAEAHPERAVKDGTEAFGKSSRLAEEYGLKECG